MIRVTIDFETANTVGIDLTVVGAEVYAAHWATEIICLCTDFSLLPLFVPGEDHPGALLGLSGNDDVIFDAHGAGFEQAIWRHIMIKRYGFPEIPIERWDDTMAVAALKQMPLALEKCAKVSDLENQKDMKGNALTKKLSKPNKQGYFDRSPETLEKVYAYCRQDVAVEAELRSRLGNLSGYERRIWELDQTINARGVRLDLEFIHRALACVDKATVPLTAEFRTLTGGLAPGQVGKLKEWLATQGVVLDDLRKETLAALLGDDNAELEDTPRAMLAELSGAAKRVLEIRQVLSSASIKKLKRMQQCVGDDGRSRGILQYHGAGTGRWSGRLWQPQNLPRGNTLAAVEMVKEGTATIGVVGHALRGCIVPDPGKFFFVGDFSGIEARIVLALSGQHDKVQLLADGKNPYCDLASSIFHRPITKENKADLEQYQIGKFAFLGCGFGMGHRKFKERYAPNETDEFCQGVINTYRKEWAPHVPELWRGLESAALTAVQQGTKERFAGVEYEKVDWWLECRMPSGQTIYYFDPQLEDGDYGPFWQYQKPGNGGSQMVDVYGGLLCENVVQALARAIMVEAMFRLEAAGFPVVLTVHDEIVCEVARRLDDLSEFKGIMEQSPAWAEKIGIPIAVEAWCGDRYRK